jgi:hypothetical protein
MLRYNILAGEQTNLTILSYVLLLRPETDSPALMPISSACAPTELVCVDEEHASKTRGGLYQEGLSLSFIKLLG